MKCADRNKLGPDRILPSKFRFSPTNLYWTRTGQDRNDSSRQWSFGTMCAYCYWSQIPSLLLLLEPAISVIVSSILLSEPAVSIIVSPIAL